MTKIICFAVALYSCLAFAKTGLTYFDQYSENKNEFLRLSARVPTNKWLVLNDQWAINADPNLTTNVAVFKQLKIKSETLLVFSSGIHGVEGFVGSALQRWFLEENLIAKKSLNVDLAMLHSLNPWGMQNKRRVSAENIDLNRNFSDSDSIFSKTNDDYMKIDSFLNPQEKLRLGFFHRASFLFDSVRLILKYSIETLRKSILLGQNQQPRGLYYAGTAATPLKAKIDSFMAEVIKDYKKIIWIDLHTGYGTKGKLHLLANDSKSIAGEELRKQFKSTPIDFGDQKNFYKTDGDLVSYLARFNQPDHLVTAVVFEYGTLDSQTTLGSMESLRRMLIENQAYQNGATSSEASVQANALFYEMFIPKEEVWVQQILNQTESALLNLNLVR
ncbi:MAG: DUF2817 domain-containing protein [Bdellovibrio sp.]|nr:DUF2817 domain-containing protein [Bdellovibrio sp.]